MTTSTVSGRRMGTPIPTPDDFPVVWENPEDEQFHWRRGRTQTPARPLGLHVGRTIYGGFNTMLANAEMRLRFETRHVNYYVYFRMYLDESLPELTPSQIRAIYDGHMERWRGEILPTFTRIIERFGEINLQQLSLPDLIAQFDDHQPMMSGAALLHFQAMIPIEIAMHEFLTLYRDLFSNDGPTDPYRLLQGLNVATAATGDLLWEYSRRALGDDELLQPIAELPAADTVAVLRMTDSGQQFLADLQIDLPNLPYPWLRDITTAIRHIQKYVSQPDRDFAAERRAQAVDRDTHLAEIRARLRGYPKPVRDEFEYLLGMARDFTIISEEHRAKMDMRWFHRVGNMAAEIGRRFVDAGALDDPGDIWLLYIEEIRDQPAILNVPDLRNRVAERKAKIEHFAGIFPPHELGSRPARPLDDPVYRAVMEDFGEPPPAPSELGLLTGAAASAGVVRGMAKVIITLDQADRLEPSDILITRLTDEAWSPLFAVASAVVTDYGGALIHAAVVAREYGLPAVVGTGYATTTIHDGQMIEVDGSAGIVRILGE